MKSPFKELCTLEGKWTSCESVSFSVNANLEKYFREAIIHLASPPSSISNPSSPPSHTRHYITR